MNAEISFFGVFTPSILPCALLAALFTSALTRLLAAVGFYRLVWHRALFNFSMFVCALAATLAAASRLSL
jgi:hypothetical protein